ncbi:GGDEF domain-containing protein [Aureimonas sp. AU20]|uniref:GGDEF domain-containing protein n=1 Tax=Aureimonas sp. AU20 TaxID=1349819 RepID=UPI00072018E1|nr:GGDEF domain-containing protein [Aureimonas sp. AU20]ALN71561.1 hypothetical protein M673_02480 [Aureimonas sp. AU20]
MDASLDRIVSMSLAAVYLLGAQRAPGSQGPECDPRVDESTLGDPLEAVQRELAHTEVSAAPFQGELEVLYQTERKARRPAFLKSWLKLWSLGQSAVASGLLLAVQGSDLPFGAAPAVLCLSLGVLALPLSWMGQPSLLLGGTMVLVAAATLLQLAMLFLVAWADQTAPLAMIVAPLVTLALLCGSPLPTRWSRIGASSLALATILADFAALSGRDALVAGAGALTLRLVVSHVSGRLSQLNRESFLLRRQAELQLEQGQIERGAMERLAKMDALTGISNRRAFDGCLIEHLTRARPNSPVCVALLDIDYFKALNDSAGHLSGDECLRRVAVELRKAAGPAFVARYGGEEFAILFELAEGDDPLERLERLREAVLGLDIAHPGRPGELVTISIGGTMAVEAENSRVVLDRADTALYRAKTQGRNRVEMETKLPRVADTASLKRLLDVANHGRNIAWTQRDSA